MTASRTKPSATGLRRGPICLRFVRLALLTGGTAGALTFAAAAHDPEPAQPERQTQEDAQPEKQDEKQGKDSQNEQIEQAEAARRAVAERRQRRRLWYLGAQVPRPTTGAPALGTPLKILPQPFVPPGSLSNPQESLTEGTELIPLGDKQETSPQNNTSTPVSGDPFGGIEESSLARIDPSLRALSDLAPAISRDDAQPQTGFLWQGYSRDDAAARLNQLAGGAGSKHNSRVYRNSLKQLARGRFDLPGRGDDDAAVAKLMLARLNLMAGVGDWQGYRALLASLDPQRSWPGFTRLRVEQNLLAGNVTEACLTAEQQRSDRANAYWVRVTALCSALDGNRSAVDFQYSVLEEITDVKPAFYQLIDMILLEAEANKSGRPELSRPRDQRRLQAALPVTGLHSAMARLAGVTIERVDTSVREPLAVASLLSLPGLSGDARADLTMAMARLGLVQSDVLASFMRRHTTQASANALDGTLKLAAWGATAADRRAGGNTGEDSTSLRIAAARSLWAAAVAEGWAAMLAPALMDVLADIPAKPLLGADLGWLARAALLAGDRDRARAFFVSLRSRPVGEDPIADDALTALVPVMVMADSVELALLSATRLQALLDNSTAGRFIAPADSGFALASSYLSVLDALTLDQGTSAVLDARWQQLEQQPLVQPGSTVNPAPWRAFLKAGRKADVPGLMLHLESLLYDQPLRNPNAALTGSVIAALKGHGLDAMAADMALERLVLAGL